MSEQVELTSDELGILRRVHLNVCGCKNADCRVRQGLHSVARLVAQGREDALAPTRPPLDPNVCVCAVIGQGPKVCPRHLARPSQDAAGDAGSGT